MSSFLLKFGYVYLTLITLRFDLFQCIRSDTKQRGQRCTRSPHEDEGRMDGGSHVATKRMGIYSSWENCNDTRDSLQRHCKFSARFPACPSSYCKMNCGNWNFWNTSGMSKIATVKRCCKWCYSRHSHVESHTRDRARWITASSLTQRSGLSPCWMKMVGRLDWNFALKIYPEFRLNLFWVDVDWVLRDLNVPVVGGDLQAMVVSTLGWEAVTATFLQIRFTH